MKNANTLEEFIKNYINNVKLSSSPESYAEWLKSYGVDSHATLDRSLKDISTDYQKAKSSFGANAESLASLGLGASGYSDYLSGKAYESMQRRKEGAFEKFAENEKSNRSGYRDYVEKKLEEITEKAESEAERENERFYKTVDDIVDAGISDVDEAYGFAIEAGLSEEKATAVARTATDAVKKKRTKDALTYILNHGFDKDQAKQYALAMGLSTQEAALLADYADKINADPYLSSDYLDYLKYKENLYK